MPVFLESAIKEGMKKLDPGMVEMGQSQDLPGGGIDWDNLDFSPKEEPAPKPTTNILDWDNLSFDPNVPIPAQATGREVGLYQGGKETIFDKIRGWFHTPDVSPDKAANIAAMIEVTGLPADVVYRHYDELAQEMFPGSMTGRRMLKSTVDLGMTAGVVYGLYTNPIATAIAVGTFLGLDEVENAIVAKAIDEPYEFQGGRGLSDWLAAEGLSRDVVDTFDFLWKVPVAGGTSKAGRGLIGKIVRRLGDKTSKIGFINRLAERIKKSGETEPDSRSIEDMASDVLEDMGVPRETIGLAKEDIAKEAVSIERVLKNERTSPEKPKELSKPAEVDPDYTFTSKKGNYYEKIGNKWYDQKGKEVTNKFIIDAAEGRKVEYGASAEEAAEDKLVSDIEKEYGKKIDEVTDAEIEKFIDKEERAAAPRVEEPAPEPVTPPEQSAFRQTDRERTKFNLKNLPTYDKIDNADSLIARMEAEVNGWMDGEVADISATRKLIEQLSDNAGKWADGSETPPGIFGDLTYSELLNFSEYIGKLDRWVRSIEEPQPVRPVEKVVEPTEVVSKPEMAVLLKDGRIISGKEKNHVDLIERNKIDPDNVQASGFVSEGKFGINTRQKGNKWVLEPGKISDWVAEEARAEGYDLREGTATGAKLGRTAGGFGGPAYQWKKFADVPKEPAPAKPVERVVEPPKAEAKPKISTEEAEALADAKRIADIEEHYGKPIDKVTDQEIEDYYTKGAEDVDWFGEGEESKGPKGGVQLNVMVPLDKAGLETARRLKEMFGKFTAFLENPMDQSPAIKFRVGERKTYVEKTPFTEHDPVTGAVVKTGIADETRRLYPIEGYDPIDKQWKEYTWAESEGEAKAKISEYNRWLTEQKAIYGDATSFTLHAGIPIDKGVEIFNRLTGRDKTKVMDEPPDPFTGVKEEVRELIFKRTAQLGLATYDTNKFVNSIEQRTTKKQREVTPFVIEKTGIPDEAGRPDLQVVLARDRKYLEPMAEEVKVHFDAGFRKVKENLKDMTVKQIWDYVTHLWDIPRHKKAEAVSWFQTQDRFMERRFIPTYEEGIKKGFKPKTLDITEIIKVHDNVGNRAVENTKYLKALLDLDRHGIKLIQRSEDAPLDWVEVDYPALTRRIPLKKTQIKRKGEFVKEVKVKVHPDLVRPLKAIFEQRFDHPIIGAYEAINGVMKKSMLTLSLFHHGALSETGLALMGPVKTAKVIFDPVKIYKALVKGEYDVFKKEEIARDGIEHGLQFGATADIPVSRVQGYLNELARVTENIPGGNRVTKFVAGLNSVWDKALWNYLHDTLKLYGYESLVSKLDPKLSTEMVKKSKREIAQFVNDTFGGQNFENMLFTPKEVQMLTWSLLSMDWTLSTTRQALAPTGIGRIYKETAGLRRGMGLKFWTAAALYFGLGMNLLNVMYRQKDMKENPQYYGNKEYSFLDKTMLGNTVGKKTYLFLGRYKDGSERYVRWGKQFRDFFEMLVNFRPKVGGKIAPLPQRIVEWFTGSTFSGYRGDDLYGNGGLEYVTNTVKYIGKSFLPLSVRKFLQEDVEVNKLDFLMQSSKGMSRYSAMEYYKKAILTGDVDMAREVYTGALRNNLPAYSLFTAAFGWVESEARGDLARTVKDIETAKARLASSTSAYDKRRYGQLIARLSKEAAEKKNGMNMISAMIQKLESYNELTGDIPPLPRRR